MFCVILYIRQLEMGKLQTPLTTVTMWNRVVVFSFLVGAAFAGPFHRSGISQCSRSCSSASENLKYQTGQTYIYDYQARVSPPSKNQENDVLLQTKVELAVFDQCDMGIQFRDVRLKGLRPDHEAQLKESLETGPLYFHFEDGKIGEICPSAQQPFFATNIMRGFLSAFQTDMDVVTNRGKTEHPEVDITGECQTSYTVTDRRRNDITIKKEKDMTSCSHHHGGQLPLFLEDLLSQANITSPFEKLFLRSKHVCQTVTSNDIIKTVQCKETHRTILPGNALRAETESKISFESKQIGIKIPKVPTSEPTSLLFVHDETFPSYSLNDAKQLMKEMCAVSTHTILPEASQIFNHFAEALSQLTQDELHSLYQYLKQGNQPCDKQSMRNLFVDAVVAADSGEAYAFLAQVLRDGEINDAKANVLYLLLPTAKNITEESIKAFVPILKSAESQPPLLGISGMIGKFCRKNKTTCHNVPAVKHAMDALVDRLPNKYYTSTKTEDDLHLLLLKAIGNIGPFGEAAEAVMEIFLNKQTKEFLRIMAIESLRHVPCQPKIQNQALSVLSRESAPSVIRNVAFLHLMRCPTHDIIRELVKKYTMISSEQVGTFMYSYFNNLQRTTDPAKQEAKQIMARHQIPEIFPSSFRNSSRNYEISKYLQNSLGFTKDIQVLFPDKGVLPRYVDSNMTFPSLGYRVQHLLYHKGLEHYLEKALRSQGFVHNLHGNLPEYLQSFIPKEAVDGAIQILKELIGEGPSEELEIMACMRYHGLDVGHISFEDIRQIIDNVKSLNSEDVLSMLPVSNEISQTHALKFLDVHIRTPTIVGLPLVLDVNGTVVAQFGLEGRSDVSDIRNYNADIDLDVKPSVSAQLSAQLSIDTYFSKPGLKVEATLHSSVPFGIKAQIQDVGIARFSARLLSNRTSFISVTFDSYEITPTGEHHKQLRRPGDNVTKCIEIFETKTCLNLQVPSPVIPLIPLPSAISFSSFIDKIDPYLEGVEAVFLFSPGEVDGQRTYIASVDTPGSIKDRHYSVAVSVQQSPDGGHVQLSLRTPSGHRCESEEEMKTFQERDEQEEERHNLGVRRSRSVSGYEYRGSNSPRRKPSSYRRGSSDVVVEEDRRRPTSRRRGSSDVVVEEDPRRPTSRRRGSSDVVVEEDPRRPTSRRRGSSDVVVDESGRRTSSYGRGSSDVVVEDRRIPSYYERGSSDVVVDESGKRTSSYGRGSSDVVVEDPRIPSYYERGSSDVIVEEDRRSPSSRRRGNSDVVVEEEGRLSPHRKLQPNFYESPWNHGGDKSEKATQASRMSKLYGSSDITVNVYEDEARIQCGVQHSDISRMRSSLPASRSQFHSLVNKELYYLSGLAGGNVYNASGLVHASKTHLQFHIDLTNKREVIYLADLDVNMKSSSKQLEYEAKATVARGNEEPKEIGARFTVNGSSKKRKIEVEVYSPNMQSEPLLKGKFTKQGSYSLLNPKGDLKVSTDVSVNVPRVRARLVSTTFKEDRNLVSNNTLSYRLFKQREHSALINLKLVNAGSRGTTKISASGNLELSQVPDFSGKFSYDLYVKPNARYETEVTLCTEEPCERKTSSLSLIAKMDHSTTKGQAKLSIPTKNVDYEGNVEVEHQKSNKPSLNIQAVGKKNGKKVAEATLSHRYVSIEPLHVTSEGYMKYPGREMKYNFDHQLANNNAKEQIHVQIQKGKSATFYHEYRSEQQSNGQVSHIYEASLSSTFLPGPLEHRSVLQKSKKGLLLESVFQKEGDDVAVINAQISSRAPSKLRITMKELEITADADISRPKKEAQIKIQPPSRKPIAVSGSYLLQSDSAELVFDAEYDAARKPDQKLHVEFSGKKTGGGVNLETAFQIPHKLSATVDASVEINRNNQELRLDTSWSTPNQANQKLHVQAMRQQNTISASAEYGNDLNALFEATIGNDIIKGPHSLQGKIQKQRRSLVVSIEHEIANGKLKSSASVTESGIDKLHIETTGKYKKSRSNFDVQGQVVFLSVIKNWENIEGHFQVAKEARRDVAVNAEASISTKAGSYNSKIGLQYPGYGYTKGQYKYSLDLQTPIKNYKQLSIVAEADNSQSPQGVLEISKNSELLLAVRAAYEIARQNAYLDFNMQAPKYKLQELAMRSEFQKVGESVKTSFQIRGNKKDVLRTELAYDLGEYSGHLDVESSVSPNLYAEIKPTTTAGMGSISKEYTFLVNVENREYVLARTSLEQRRHNETRDILIQYKGKTMLTASMSKALDDRAKTSQITFEAATHSEVIPKMNVASSLQKSDDGFESTLLINFKEKKLVNQTVTHNRFKRKVTAEMESIFTPKMFIELSSSKNSRSLAQKQYHFKVEVEGREVIAADVGFENEHSKTAGILSVAIRESPLFTISGETTSEGRYVNRYTLDMTDIPYPFTVKGIKRTDGRGDNVSHEYEICRHTGRSSHCSEYQMEYSRPEMKLNAFIKVPSVVELLLHSHLDPRATTKEVGFKVLTHDKKIELYGDHQTNADGYEAQFLAALNEHSYALKAKHSQNQYSPSVQSFLVELIPDEHVSKKIALEWTYEKAQHMRQTTSHKATTKLQLPGYEKPAALKVQVDESKGQRPYEVKAELEFPKKSVDNLIFEAYVEEEMRRSQEKTYAFRIYDAARKTLDTSIKVQSSKVNRGQTSKKMSLSYLDENGVHQAGFVQLEVNTDVKTAEVQYQFSGSQVRMGGKANRESDDEYSILAHVESGNYIGRPSLILRKEHSALKLIYRNADHEELVRATLEGQLEGPTLFNLSISTPQKTISELSLTHLSKSYYDVKLLMPVEELVEALELPSEIQELLDKSKLINLISESKRQANILNKVITEGLIKPSVESFETVKDSLREDLMEIFEEFGDIVAKLRTACPIYNVTQEIVWPRLRGVLGEISIVFEKTSNIVSKYIRRVRKSVHAVISELIDIETLKEHIEDFQEKLYLMAKHGVRKFKHLRKSLCEWTPLTEVFEILDNVMSQVLEDALKYIYLLSHRVEDHIAAMTSSEMFQVLHRAYNEIVEAVQSHRDHVFQEINRALKTAINEFMPTFKSPVHHFRFQPEIGEVHARLEFPVDVARVYEVCEFVGARDLIARYL